MRRAYRVTVAGVTGIVAAEKRSHATITGVYSAKETGYFRDWKGVRCVRAPEYDWWASGDKARLGFISESYIIREYHGGNR